MFPKSSAVILALAGALLLAGCETQTASTGRNPIEATPMNARMAALPRGTVVTYMDRQEAELRRDLRDSGISVTRDGDNLVLNMEDDILFDTNSAAVKPRARDVIRSVALVLRQFRSTYVDVDGFTDTTGTRDYNLDLSTRRADAVADELAAGGIDPARLATRGYGEDYLKVPTHDGVAEPRNRRVEITLEPYTG